tara:strand:- start:833 stop:1228 length:396 start_codon:yes stop_codon:yes gene_type:complete
MEVTTASFLYVVSTAFLGMLSPIETYFSVHVGTDCIDTEQPMISFGVQHEVKNINLFIEHQSSPMTLKDAGLDHFGFKYNFDNNFYIGASKKINSCNSCSTEVSLVGGYEKEKLFVEYSHNRIYSGLKFSF